MLSSWCKKVGQLLIPKEENLSNDKYHDAETEADGRTVYFTPPTFNLIFFYFFCWAGYKFFLIFTSPLLDSKV